MTFHDRFHQLNEFYLSCEYDEFEANVLAITQIQCDVASGTAYPTY